MTDKKPTKKPTRVIYVGHQKYDLFDRLSPYFEYEVADIESLTVQDKPIFENNGLASEFRNDYFLLDATTADLLTEERAIALPANQILIDINVMSQLSPRIQDILRLKGTFEFDLTDLDFFAEQMTIYFYTGGGGTILRQSIIDIAPRFQRQLRVVGYSWREIKGNFGESWQGVAICNQPVIVAAHEANTFIIEYDQLGDAELEVRVEIRNIQNLALEKTIRLTGKAQQHDKVDIEGGASGKVVNVSYWARGNGAVRLGLIHFQRSRGKYGIMLPNGERLISEASINGELDVYFDAGNLKPPLNIYFAGWRPKEFFEANFMMRHLEHPFLLFTDNRFEGGSFYIGDEDLEAQVVEKIQATLNRLGFQPQDLVLSGLSMGTYASLYYAAKLQPAAVVVGKPLVNLGAVAQAVRLIRPGEFPAANDVLLAMTGDNDNRSAERLNQRFWRAFSAGDFSKTAFMIAYMKNDDYDVEAFPQLLANLKQRPTPVKILSKGLVGHHNDNTGGIVNWFLTQYRYVLRVYFDQKEDVS